MILSSILDTEPMSKKVCEIKADRYLLETEKSNSHQKEYNKVK